VAAFLRDSCIVGAGSSVEVARLWEAWKTWCEQEGRAPGSKSVFGRDLHAAAPTVKKTRPQGENGRTHVYEGITYDRSHNRTVAMTAMTTVTETHPGHSSHSTSPTHRHGWVSQQRRSRSQRQPARIKDRREPASACGQLVRRVVRLYCSTVICLSAARAVSAQGLGRFSLTQRTCCSDRFSLNSPSWRSTTSPRPGPIG